MSTRSHTRGETFPAEFLWGVATSAYQIEGATDADGRGASIWDRFCSVPGKVRNGETGEVACDFYHRYPEDIALLRELGVTAFRFSVAWPRVLPDGWGGVNQAGLDFYDRLVDALLEAGIRPVATLYHWDLPVAVQDRGGWPARDTAHLFADYAAIVANRLGDRVRDWITQNEPWVIAWLGHGNGEHAPGRESRAEALAAGHHVLLSHGLAVEPIRQAAPGSRVGITIDLTQFYPASRAPDDLAAARELDGSRNRWFLDPVFGRGYPEDVLAAFAPDEPPVRDGDLELISAPIDFLGINYYTRQIVAAGPHGPEPVRQEGALHTDMDWEVAPDALLDLLLRLHSDYTPPPIWITENGAAFRDARTHDGEVRDPERADYLSTHVGAIGRALDAGVPVGGYFAWTLLDNFEWAFGYAMRFGIVYVDFETLERVPKASFYRYRQLIAERRPPAATKEVVADRRSRAKCEVVVVGVDSGPAGRGALRWALRHAARTGARVRAVRAWHVPFTEQVVAEVPDLDLVPSSLPPTSSLRDQEHALQDQAIESADRVAEVVDAQFERAARRDLEGAIDGARASTGATSVGVEAAVVEGDAREVLADAGDGAALLVVGCRDRGPVAERVLGSVSRHLLREAPCPVVVVPEHVGARPPAYFSAPHDRQMTDATERAARKP